MSSLSSRSGLKLRILGSGLVSAILMAGIVCQADDKPGRQSCRDDSTAPSTIGAIGPGGSSSATKLHSVRLSWDASVPKGNAPADAVKGYNIYRHEPGKAYEQINLVPIRETSCTDYAAKAGHTYIYQAKAVSMRGAVSDPSNQATASVPSR